MKTRDRRARHPTLVFEWRKGIGFVQPPKFISRILPKFHLNTTRTIARFMTVPGYVDTDDLVWRCRCVDSTSAAACVGQCVVIVGDTSSRNRNYSLFSYASRPPAMQGATLISNSRRTTSPTGAPCWMGRVLFDEAKKPKPESRDGSAYFAILTLLGL